MENKVPTDNTGLNMKVPTSDIKSTHLFELLVKYGGTIESSNSLDTMNINQARASGRMYVDENSLGFVWMPGDFSNGPFPETPEEVELFEKWFPLDVEMPEKLKNPDWLYEKRAIEQQKDNWQQEAIALMKENEKLNIIINKLILIPLWVNASERLPDKHNQPLHLKINLGGNRLINKCGFLNSMNKFSTESGDYDIDVVQWLDESETNVLEAGQKK